MNRKFLILGLALSTACASLSFADESACTPKKAHLRGQTVELTESCMLSFPGYGNNNYGRSYIDQIGSLFVFAEVAKTGITSKDYGTRTYYLLPVRQASDFEVDQKTGDLLIHHSSGETMTLDKDFRVKSFTGVEFTEAEKSSDANKGGFEIKRYSNGILLDTGWTHSSFPIQARNNSVFTDRKGRTCKVQNKEIFDFVHVAADEPVEAVFKFPKQEELKSYLKQRCPNLDLSPLDAARSLSSVSASESETESVNCRCIFNGTKDYQLFEETKSIFGRRKVHRKWTCEYSCQAGPVTETLVGNYDMTNHGEDNGLEGICEGTVYEAQFNSVVMREVYMYKSTESFNPRKGNAAELKQWAQKQNCAKGSWFR